MSHLYQKLISAFEVSLGVRGAPLNHVTEADAPNAAIIVHELNLTNSDNDVMISVYPAANRTYDVYVNFDEEATMEDYEFLITVLNRQRTDH